MSWNDEIAPGVVSPVIPIDPETVNKMIPAAVKYFISKLNVGERIKATNAVYTCITLRKAWVNKANSIISLLGYKYYHSRGARENCLILKEIRQRIEDTESELESLVRSYRPTFSPEGDGYRILENCITKIEEERTMRLLEGTNRNDHSALHHPIEPVSIIKESEELPGDNTQSIQKKKRRHTPHQVYSDEMIMDYYRCRLKKNMKCYQAAEQTFKKHDFEVTVDGIDSFTHCAARRWKIFSPEQKKTFSIKC